jgi:hypothetical protein
VTNTVWTAESVLEAIGKVRWYHSFELCQGVITPGITSVDPKGRLDMFGLPDDLRGARALDIGTWDGPVAFELERRGATVTALDIQDPNLTGFNTAKAILGSQVEYVQSDVVAMPAKLQGRYDLVIYCGVFYHLKDPIGAFQSIALVMTDQSQLCFEGEALIHYAEALDGVSDRLLPLDAIASSRVPLALCYPGAYKQASNWFVPNLACLESWLGAAGLMMATHRFYSRPDSKPFPTQRISGTARKVGAAREEHPLVGQTIFSKPED